MKSFMKFITPALVALVAIAPSVAFATRTVTADQLKNSAQTQTYTVPSSSGALTTREIERADGFIKNYNVLPNGDFEDATYSTDWTASGGTLAAAATTNIFYSKGATWDASSASQTFSSGAVSVPEGYKGNNCEASMYIKVPSGTATHLIQAWDGTNILASASVVNSTYFTKNTVTFPCPTSGTIALRLISVASDEPLIALDEGYLGLARNVGVADLTTEWASFTPNYTNIGFSTFSANIGYWRRNGTNLEVYQFFNPATGSGSASAFSWAIPTDANCTPDSKFAFENTSEVGQYFFYNDSGGAAGDSGTLTYSTTTTVRPLTGTSASFTTSVMTTSDTFTATYTIPCSNWAASTVVMPDAQGWWAGASLGAATSVNLSTTSVAKNEIDQNDITLAAMTGSAAVGVVCASGNPSPVGGTICSAGNEVVGITTNVPRSGSYEVCVGGANLIQDSGAATNASLFNQFIIDYTSSSSSTAIQAGVAQATSGLQTNSAGGGEVLYNIYPFRVCDTFQVSAGQATFRTTVTVTASGTVAANNLQPNNGQTYITVRPVTAQQQATLANSVIARDAVGGQVTTINTIVSKTTTYTATANDETIQLDASGGAWTLSLPAAAGVKGKKYHLAVTGSGTNAITIDPNSSETVCGFSTVSMVGLGDRFTIQSDGTNWIGLDESCTRRTSLYVGTTCTSTPCTVTTAPTLWYTSVSRSGTGAYTVNIPSGVFRGAPACISKCSNGAQVFFSEGATGADTATSAAVNCYSSAVALTDARLSIMCVGAR